MKQGNACEASAHCFANNRCLTSVSSQIGILLNQEWSHHGPMSQFAGANVVGSGERIFKRDVYFELITGFMYK